MVKAKVRGDMLREMEVKQIVKDGGEVWVSYIEYRYTDNNFEKACKAELSEDGRFINIDDCDASEYPLTGRPRAMCCFDGFGEFELSLHAVVKSKNKTKKEAIADLFKLAEEAIDSKDSEMSELVGDVYVGCQRERDDWQRRLDNAKGIIGG